jgi:predicted MPP superfamily phosphohydrolase
VIFIIVVISVLTFIYGTIALRLIPSMTQQWGRRMVLGIGMAVLAYLPLLPGVLRFNGIENPLVDLLAWIGYLDLGFFSLVFVFLIAKDLVLGSTWLAVRAAGFMRRRPRPDHGPKDGGRRIFVASMVNWGVVGTAGMLTGCGIYQALKRPELFKVDIPVQGLPRDLDGLRIVQITDIHVGGTIKGDYVRTVVNDVNALGADLVVCTGDLVDGSVDYLKQDVAPLADLKAPLGTFFVTGNHEYYSGVLPWIDEVSRLGFDVLLNENRILGRGQGRLLLAGVTDYRGGQFIPSHASNPQKALRGAGRHDYKILLAHQPKSIFAAERAGYDLMLAGHTHGGQYFPGNLLVPLNQPYTAGLHQHGRTMVYVSRGTGYWGPPLRIATRSEITEFKLLRI